MRHHGQQTVESNDTTTVTESNVSLVMSKRLRNARKRLGKIREIQRKEARGEILNDDQRMALSHVMGQEMLVEELEKLSELVDTAAKEDLCNVLKDKEMCKKKVQKEYDVIMATKIESVKKKYDERMEARVKEAAREGMVTGVERIIELLYLSGIFDPFIPYQMEKNAVLQYIDTSEEGMDGHTYGEMLDMIGVLGKMMTTRPLGEVQSHEKAVRQCQDVALTYAIGNPESVMGWNGCMTKNQVEMMVKRIKALDYFSSPGEVFPAHHHMWQHETEYVVPGQHGMVTTTHPPPPPPPPSASAATATPHVSLQYQQQSLMEYISPEEAAVSGENVLSQFFNHRVYESNKQQEHARQTDQEQSVLTYGSESLGLEEVSTGTEECHPENLNSHSEKSILVSNNGHNGTKVHNRKVLGEKPDTKKKMGSKKKQNAWKPKQAGQEKIPSYPSKKEEGDVTQGGGGAKNPNKRVHRTWRRKNAMKHGGESKPPSS